MQTSLVKLSSPVKSLAAGLWLSLFAVLALCLYAMPAMATGAAAPIILTGPATQIGTLNFNSSGGGWFSGQAPLGGTFVVGPNGDVIIGDGYGAGVFQITPAGVQSVLAAFNNSNAAGMDQYGNVYIARDYGASIIKLPYNAATGQYAGFTTLPSTNCLGGTQDTAACVFAPGTQSVISAGATAGGGNPGFTSLFFDGQGNFYFVTDTNPGTGAGGNANTIYECSANCQAETDGAGTYPPILIFTDTKPIGAVAMDPWGNLFFSDGYTDGPDSGTVSNVEELPLQSGTYASSPTLITSYTTTAGYNGIGGVAIRADGTVYFAVANDGTFAVPNSQSGPVPAGIYKVSTTGGKGIALDSTGNLYQLGYNGTLGATVVDFTPVANFSFAAAATGTASTTSVSATIIDNANSCTPTLTLTPSEFGVATTEYAVAPGSSCSAAVGTGNGTFSPALASAGALLSATITFTPTAAGARNATLIATDSAVGASGSAALTGVGQNAAATLDPGATTAYATGLTSPASVVADPAGDVFIADSGAGKVYEIANGTTTLSPVGSGFVNPTALAFDANGDLFIADDGVPAVEEISNTGTTGAFAAGSQSTVVGSKLPFEGMALASAMGLAVGPQGTIYISDPANKRVVAFDPITGQGGVTLANSSNGLASPLGLAADSSNNLYVADSSLDDIFVFASAGGFTSIKPSGVTQPTGVAVDASGSVLVADAATGNIVRIPNLSGTLTTAQSLTVETLAPQASSLWLDGRGDAYVASASGKAAYAIQRTAASINLGVVQNGLTNSGTVYLESAGNETATLASPAVVQPANTMFALAAATNNGCSDGSSGPAGAQCQFTATFAPAVGTANGTQTGTATIDIATPVASLTVNMSGTASQSSVLAQTITGFNPPTSLQVGQQTALSATGGASGNAVTFSIDPTSSCTSCASITGTTLTALAAGAVIVDANQAGGQANGNQYAAAPTVKASITIKNNLVATDVPALLMNEINWSYQSGAFTSGQNPAGGSFAVTQNGLIVVGTTYNNKADFVNASTGALVNQVAINGPGGFTIDSQNNLYMSHLYGAPVLKIPYVNGVYATLTDSTPANCTGNDTTLCTFASAPSGGVKAIAFDPSGNFYMVAVPGSTGASAIYECPASCQTGGTATTLYSDANAVSQIAFDPWGNLFFTEGAYANATNFGNDEASTSNLNELPYTAGTGFAATPTLLQTLTDASPASYDNQLDGVAVTSTGTVYYATQNEGTFAIPNTQTSGPDTTHQYVVSTLGAKGMELDAHGNEWVVVYHSGGDNIGEALLGDLTTPIAQLNGAPVTASATVVDNAFGCGTAAAIAIASSNPEFTATAGTTCSGVSAAFSTAVSGSTYPATITFAATSGGPQTATLNVSDTTNGGTGTATVTGVGQETPQTVTFTAPTTTTYTYAPALTVTLGATGGASNNAITFTVDSSSTGAGTIAGNTLTVTQAGSIVVDANQLGGLVNGVFYEPAPQVQLTLTVNQAAQAIVFPQPNSPVNFATNPSTTVQLSANGGASGNAVVFTVDSSSTGAGTISSSTLSNGTSTATLTVTGAGNIVVDANQVANVDYSAAPQVQQTIVVNQATQSITFTPLAQQFFYIASGATLTIQATGGGSDLPIVFTVDPKSTMQGSFSTSKVSGAVSTSTLTMPAGQSPTSGTIIVDANQPGNSNYSAATQMQLIIVVGAPLPTQTITFAVPQTQVGGTTLTLNGTSSSGFPVAYTSSTTSVCTVSGSTATFAKVTSASTCTITASQPGDNQYFAAAAPVTVSFTVNPAGQTPAMNLSLSLGSLTIQSGTVGLSQITLASVNNFTGTVTFACSGLPSGASCSFSTNPIKVAEGASATTTLTVTTSSTASVVRHDLRPLFPATFAIALCFMGFRKRNRLHLLLLLVTIFAGLGMLSGCGGSSSSSTTQPTTTNATVTATSGSMTASAPLTIIVE